MRRTFLRLSTSPRVLPALVLLTVLGSSACAYRARSTLIEPPSRSQLSQLWDPSAQTARRDLFHGSGGARLAPRAGASFTYRATDSRGASPGYTVVDAAGREWDVKLGPEAPVEVVVSRLLWAAGFHQPPTYFLPSWTLRGGPRPGPQPPGRFRPALAVQRRVGRWAWHENPFVGTRELRGLFVLMVLVNNWDLKTSQNAVYEIRRGAEVTRHYVVQDLGAAFGHTRWFFPGSKGDPDDYAREPLIASVQNGLVRFHYRGAWREPSLDDRITVSDVRWACGLIDRLSDRQLADAFRAGGYDDGVARRFIRIIRARVREGVQLSHARASARE